jgi:hypothetical protein
MPGYNGSNGSKNDSRSTSPEIRYLDPQRIEVERDAFDRLRLVIDGDEVYERVRIARAFPLSHPDRYLSILNSEGKEIGMVAEPGRLSSASLRLVQDELDLVYYTPVIERITSVESKHGATTWNVVTDRGEAVVSVKDRGEIRRLAGRRVLFTDVNGLKYDIPDYARLDERSRTLLESEI